MKAPKRILSILALVALIRASGAQAQNPSSLQIYSTGDSSVHTSSGHVERITKAVNYAKRAGVTSVAFQGTALLANARGEASVQKKQNRIEIAAKFDGLADAMSFGPEYLIYVMWAISPDGRATNLGEFAVQNNKSTLSVTTELQTFALIVTAEPYFAVPQPSDAVVMENFFRKGSIGQIETVEAKYELLPRGSYTANVLPSKVRPIVQEPGTPLDLYEARNALWIALWAGAEENASELFATAERMLQKAEAFHASRSAETSVSAAARESVQISEKARSLALQRRAVGKAALQSGESKMILSDDRIDRADKAITTSGGVPCFGQSLFC
jgi:hypothetical protein